MPGVELDALPLADLQHQAFAKAREAHDVGFFWDLAKHLRSARAMAAEDGSAGGLTGSITEAVEVVRELLGNRPLTDVGDDEPLLRAKLTDYLRG